MNPYLIAGGAFAAFCAILLTWGLLTETRAPLPPRTVRPRGTCHVRGCGRVAYTRIVRRDTGTPEWVCVGCREQGAAYGLWSWEAAA